MIATLQNRLLCGCFPEPNNLDLFKTRLNCYCLSLESFSKISLIHRTHHFHYNHFKSNLFFSDSQVLDFMDFSIKKKKNLYVYHAISFQCLIFVVITKNLHDLMLYDILGNIWKMKKSAAIFFTYHIYFNARIFYTSTNT